MEIGFGNGEHLAALAAAHPERDYLGIEVHRPGVGHLLCSRQTNNLTNVRASAHDAVEVLREQIAPGALDEVLVLFPDPWHKKRHHKRRLIQPPFVELIASRLQPGGVFRLATDWEHYALQMLEVLRRAARCSTTSRPRGDWMPRPDERAPTRFEKRGARLGHGVWDLAFRRLKLATRACRASQQQRNEATRLSSAKNHNITSCPQGSRRLRRRVVHVPATMFATNTPACCSAVISP